MNKIHEIEFQNIFNDILSADKQPVLRIPRIRYHSKAFNISVTTRNSTLKFTQLALIPFTRHEMTIHQFS